LFFFLAQSGCALVAHMEVAQLQEDESLVSEMTHYVLSVT